MPATPQEPGLSRETRDLRLEALHKVVTSPSFAKAPRLCSFLSYIVDKSVEGDIESLTEQQIGIHVFHRPPGYNSNDDNIVRGTARSLRQRLSTYYLTEGSRDAVRIEIPKGAYVAQFSGTQTASLDTLEEESETAATDQPSVRDAPRSNWATRVGWCLALVFALTTFWPSVHSRWLRTHTPDAPLWNTLFTSDRPTLIVPGDAGLNMYEFFEKRAVDLDSYSKQNYNNQRGEESTLADSLGERFYTPMSDLHLVLQLIRLPQAQDAVQTRVRFARDLQASDIKDANLILMGTQSYNPWVELFQAGLTLRMNWDPNQDLFTVTNLAPKAGELKQYDWTLKSGTKGGLTLVSLTDNSQGSGHVLIIEATTMVGIFAASDFLQSRQLLDPILAQAKRSDGSLRNFDVLLQSDFVREGVNNLHVLAVHIR
jgi:hypothetical protein